MNKKMEITPNFINIIFFIASPSRLENIFVESAFIDQIYVHGDALKSFLLAVVVPNIEVAHQWCKLHEKEPVELHELLKDQMFIEEIHKDIVRIGAKNRVRKKQVLQLVHIFGNNFALFGYQMRNFEIPFGVILTDEKFSEENQMLNSNFKIVRHAIAKRYKEELKQLYEQLELKQGVVQDRLLQILSSAITGMEGENKDQFKKGKLIFTAKINKFPKRAIVL